MSKQPPPAPTASAVGPCPTIIQISRTPRHWKFTRPHPEIERKRPFIVPALFMLHRLENDAVYCVLFFIFFKNHVPLIYAIYIYYAHQTTSDMIDW